MLTLPYYADQADLDSEITLLLSPKGVLAPPHSATSCSILRTEVHFFPQQQSSWYSHHTSNDMAQDPWSPFLEHFSLFSCSVQT